MDAGCGNGMDVAFAEQYVGLALELHLATILWFEEDSVPHLQRPHVRTGSHNLGPRKPSADRRSCRDDDSAR